MTLRLNTGSTFGITLGSRIFGPSETALFEVHEVLAYRSALDDTEMATIMQYLSDKW